MKVMVLLKIHFMHAFKCLEYQVFGSYRNKIPSNFEDIKIKCDHIMSTINNRTNVTPPTTTITTHTHTVTPSNSS